MMVRCGACRTQFNVNGPGRYSCPACGSVNVVRGAPGTEAPPAGGTGGLGQQPPPPAPDPPSPRIVCPECEFSFIVGNVAMAKCPNCGSDVSTGRGEVDEPAPQV
jgi:rRNA maturation endonuclease Nob1